MSGIYDKLAADIEKVKQIPIVPTMLDVICQTTGMGFAAIARVTQEKWITCGVRDDINFGLKPGDELKLETTICNEIRDSRQAVIIDHVDKDEHFRYHHTPLMYKFQSYISMPIILKNGDFFGTLCAIDPNPAELNNPKIIGMFKLFAELISFHLQSLDLMEQTNFALSEMNKQLHDSIDENRQYQYISNHNLQEPLRKIRLFSSMLLTAVETKDADKATNFAIKIDSHAQRISMMIKDLSDFSELNYADVAFVSTDLNKVVTDVCTQLATQINTRNAIVHAAPLAFVRAIPSQIEQLFYHLINNALKFSKREVTPVINIQAIPVDQNQIPGVKYIEIRITDNGIGIEQSQLEKIFDIFSQLPNNLHLQGFGVGLAYCRKIIRNHGGSISAQSEPGVGTTFSIILPVEL
jgi:signal transduction histidine kinase